MICSHYRHPVFKIQNGIKRDDGDQIFHTKNLIIRASVNRHVKPIARANETSRVNSFSPHRLCAVSHHYL